MLKNIHVSANVHLFIVCLNHKRNSKFTLREQKPRLRLHSPNKENELRQIRKPVRVTTSPHS